MSVAEQLPEAGLEQLNGFDPLAEGTGINANDRSVFEEATRRVVQNILKSYTGYFDVFSEVLQNSLDTDTYHWLEEKKKYRSDHPLQFVFDGKHISYACTPCAEQDLIALFHELVGMGLLKGIRFLCTTERDRYDGCYVGLYDSNELHSFHASKRPLGVSQKIISARESKPLVLEYKFDLDGLISDFAREEKFQNQINAIVCWKIGDAYEENYNVRSYLVGEEGSSRQLYGATHSLWHERQKLADIICVSDLMKFTADSESVIAEHKTRFKT